jgi:hypothetical protein
MTPCNALISSIALLLYAETRLFYTPDEPNNNFLEQTCKSIHYEHRCLLRADYTE